MATPTEHVCRYGGQDLRVPCGVEGHLCLACQEDRADARARAIVRAMMVVAGRAKLTDRETETLWKDGLL